MHRQVRRDDAGGDGLAGDGVVPGAGSRVRGGHGVRVARDREGDLAADVVVGVLVVVQAFGVHDGPQGHVLLAVGYHLTQVDLVRVQDQGLSNVSRFRVGGHGGHARNIEVHVGDRRVRCHAHLHDLGGQDRARKVRPFAVADAVLDATNQRLGLVTQHSAQGIREAVPTVFLAVSRSCEPPVVPGRLLAHDVDDLLAGQHGVRRLHEGRDARNVCGGLGRARRGSVDLGDAPTRVGRVDRLTWRRKVDGCAVVRRLRARQRRAQRVVVPVRLADRGDGGDAADHGGHHPGPFDGAIRNGSRVGGRVTVRRRMVEVNASVTGGGDHREPARLGAVNGALSGLQASGLLGIGRAPVDPRVHLERIVDNIHPVAGGPLVGAHEGLGVQLVSVVDGLDRHEGRLRRDTVHADVVVVGRDDAGGVRAVGRSALHLTLNRARNAVDGAGDGPTRIDAPDQVGLCVVDAGVDDAHGHRGARHGDGGSFLGAHGLGTPVRAGRGNGTVRAGDRRGGIRVGGVRGRVGGIRGRGGGIRVGGVRGRGGVRRGGRSRGRKRVREPLDVRHRGDAGRTNRMDAHPGLRQGGGQVGRERGRLTLGKKGAQLWVVRHENPTDGGNQVDSSGHLALTGVGIEVDGVVHEARAGSGGRDQANVVVGAGGRGGRRGHAHR